MKIMPYQNTSFSMSVYSDYVQDFTSISDVKYNLNISLNQTINAKDGFNLHDVISSISNTVEKFSNDCGIGNFSFSMNPSWNNPEEYNAYLNFSIKGGLDDIVKAYENLDLSEFNNPSDVMIYSPIAYDNPIFIE